MLKSLLVLSAAAFFIGCQTPPKKGAGPATNGADQTDRTAKTPLIFDLDKNEKPIEIGTSSTQQKFFLGGFSGLIFLGRENGRYLFMTHTDRGPNADEHNGQRPFPLPDFTPQWVTIEADPTTRTYRIIRRVSLKDVKGRLLLGLPQESGRQEVPITVKGEPLKPDPQGIDPEALAADSQGRLWMGEEYGPSLLRFSPEGRLLIRLAPGLGLPQHLSGRTFNRGFEGIAVQDGKIYGFLQSALPGEPGLARIVEVDEKTLTTTAEYSYPFANGADKIGDVFGLGRREFLVLEIDSEKGPKAIKRIYRVRLGRPGEKVEKTMYFNLSAAGYPYQKPEGLALTDDGKIAVMNDNDFEVAEGPVDLHTGQVPRKSEPSRLMLYEP